MSLTIAVDVNDETAQITTTFDHEVATAIIAAHYAIINAEVELGKDIFGSDYDREHFMAFASAVKQHFDIVEALA